MKNTVCALTVLLTGTALPEYAAASTGPGMDIDLTGHWVGILAIVVFVVAYLLVMAEEFNELRKSKPVILAAGAGKRAAEAIHHDIQSEAT